MTSFPSAIPYECSPEISDSLHSYSAESSVVIILKQELKITCVTAMTFFVTRGRHSGARELFYRGEAGKNINKTD